MSAAGGLDYQQYKYGDISHGYNFLGIAKGYQYVDYDTGAKKKNWNGIIPNHERLEVSWSTVELGRVKK